MACAFETLALPIAAPFNPLRSIRAPAESAPAPGFRNAHPVERSASGCVSRRRRIDAAARCAAFESRVNSNVAAVTIQPAYLLREEAEAFFSLVSEEDDSAEDTPGDDDAEASSMNGLVLYPNALANASSASRREKRASTGMTAKSPPSGLTASISTSASRVSRPSAPAFMNTAPPTVPGMPTANSSPDHPARLSAAPSW